MPPGGERPADGEACRKLRFAGDDWVDAAEAVLRRLAVDVGDELRGVHLVVSERFTAVPADLPGAAADGSRGWSFEIRDGAVTVQRSARTDADYQVLADYQAVLPVARTLYSDDPAAMAEATARAARLQAAGLVSSHGALDHVHPALRSLLRELHNRLAAITA